MGGVGAPRRFTLRTHFEGFLRQQGNGGRYASASAVVRDCLGRREEAFRSRSTSALTREFRSDVPRRWDAAASDVIMNNPNESVPPSC
ncbi:type II toxin-antitoxin system ParD family antitoxin [Novosphingobium flavum]|uniref:Type II toxin-antitoxin system ParD family antitoxin n=1 Tax=Novosphingobium flavum TaxID=1778672 RepID=A0A7X1FPZ0_9SPHN|nr:type II toxin-antitoxin system ParD family antitoxin [Novosphingobium flavum]